MGTLQEVREKEFPLIPRSTALFSDGEKEKEAEYYIRLGHEAYDSLDGDKVAQIAPQEEMGLEEFTQELRSTEAGEELKHLICRSRRNSTERSGRKKIRCRCCRCWKSL